MTQLELAKKGIVSPLVKTLSRDEAIKPSFLSKYIRQGRAVILNNRLRRIKKPCAVGFALRTKVNANIGTSTDKYSIDYELKKLDAAIRGGADAIMDLSVGSSIAKTRCEILRRSPVPVGTVPIYEIAVRAEEDKGDFLKFDADDVFEVLEAQAREGVDFFTIHAGVTAKTLESLKRHKRVLGIVSRGAAILERWMRAHKKENPFFKHFDRVIDIARNFDVTISLGDGLRPGSIFDASDAAQFAELKLLGTLALRARNKGVQVIIEGPGHLPLDQIQKNIRMEKKYCAGAPFYVLGPLVTDVACGWDHINSAIGSAIAASCGADFLCYVTASEHLRHPSVEDVYDGVIAARIAAHAADIVKLNPAALNWDRLMSEARSARDWKKQIKLSIDPEKARKYRLSSKPQISDVCTMCGKFCSIKLGDQHK